MAASKFNSGRKGTPQSRRVTLIILGLFTGLVSTCLMGATGNGGGSGSANKPAQAAVITTIAVENGEVVARAYTTNTGEKPPKGSLAGDLYKRRPGTGSRMERVDGDLVTETSGNTYGLGLKARAEVGDYSIHATYRVWDPVSKDWREVSHSEAHLSYPLPG